MAPCLVPIRGYIVCPNPNVLCEDFLTLFPFQTTVMVIRAEHVQPLPTWCLSYRGQRLQVRVGRRDVQGIFLPFKELSYDILSQGNSTNEH